MRIAVLSDVHGNLPALEAVLEERANGWQSTFMAVPYDHVEAARLAAENGFPQWRESLVYGWAGPESLRQLSD